MSPPGHQPAPKNVLLDLRKANRAQLLEAGLLPQNISVSDLCTACRRDLLFSYRKDAGTTGRLMSVIGLRSEEHTSELQSQSNLVCRLLLEKKKTNSKILANSE